MLAPGYFHPERLPKDSPAHKHFKEAQGRQNIAVVRCLVAKHSACREGQCAVKKSVKCHSVCKRDALDYNPNTATSNPSLTKDCGAVGKKLCEGHYTDADGKKQSFGAMACREIAMMA